MARSSAAGASDDKGQVLLHTLGLRACLAAGSETGAAGAPPVSLKFLIEGEEESGSPHFADLLRSRADRLSCDMIVISDTTMWAADVPSMCTGMRGLIDAQIDLRGADTDVHSGSFGGGVPNPLHALAALLAGLHDHEGRVTLPGFYDAVLPLTDAERELFARLPFDEKAWLADAGGSQAAAGEAGFSTLERVWARPTAEINGMWGGHTGPGAKTIVPSQAHAKVSFRLVANQEPADIAVALAGVRGGAHPAGHRGDRDVRRPWGAARVLAASLAGGAGRQAGHGARVRPRGAVHPGRWQRPGGRSRRDPGRAAGLRRGGPG